MRYLFRGHRKKLHETADALAETYGAECSYKTGTFRLVLTRRRKEEQYVFVADVREDGDTCLLDGEIKLVGRPWRWYDYAFSVLMCLLVIPAAVLFISPALSGTGVSTAGATVAALPLFSPTRKAREEKLRRVMALFTEELS